MAIRVKKERRTFTAGMVNSPSVFGAGGDASLLPIDGFRVDPTDADGTGVWIRPNSGGILAHYAGERAVAAPTMQASISGAISRSLYVVDSDGTDRLVVYARTVSGDEVWDFLSDTGLKTSGLSGNNLGDMVAWKNFVLVVNGADTPFKVDIGTGTASDIGLTRPDVTNATATLADDAGRVKKTVKYYIAQVSGTAEGALSVAFGEVDAEDGDKVTVDLTHADFGSNKYRVYRTYADREAPNYLFAMRGGQTKVDNKPDDNLGDIPRYHGDQPPAEISSLVIHRELAFGLAGNDLYFSDPGQPESWWTAVDGNVLAIHKDDGDVGTALVRDVDGILIFKKDHLYKLYGKSPAEFELSDALTTVDGHSVGTPTVNSVVSVPGGIVFYWNGRVYFYAGGRIQRVSEPVEDIWIDPDLIDGGPYPDESEVALGYDPRFGHVYVSFSTSGGNNNQAYILDVNTGQWVGASQVGGRSFTYYPGGSTLTNREAPRFYCFSSGASADTHYKLVDKSLADESGGSPAFPSRFTPASAFLGGDFNLTKRWLYLDFVWVQGRGDAVTVTPRIDGLDLDPVAVTIPNVALSSAPNRTRVNIVPPQMGYQLEYEVKVAAQLDWALREVVAGFQEIPSRSV